MVLEETPPSLSVYSHHFPYPQIQLFLISQSAEVVRLDIIPSSSNIQPIDVPPVQPCGPLRSSHGQHYPARQPTPDIRNYPQHELFDDDPERETKRQENVQTTLRMIDDALNFSK